MRLFAKILLLLIALLVCALTALFLWRTVSYYWSIKKGALPDLGRYAAEFTRRPSSDSRQPTPADPLQIASSDDPFLGNPNAPVAVVEFGDFECPFCRKAFPTLRALAQEYGDRVKFIFRDFPIEALHPHARAAHTAAACAHEQGKFWSYHDKLYQNQERLADADLKNYAVGAGLDPAQFDQCVREKRYAREIDADYKDGLALGVAGTPTWFLVSRGSYEKIEGALPFEVWRWILNTLIKSL